MFQGKSQVKIDITFFIGDRFWVWRIRKKNSKMCTYHFIIVWSGSQNDEKNNFIVGWSSLHPSTVLKLSKRRVDEESRERDADKEKSL